MIRQFFISLVFGVVVTVGLATVLPFSKHQRFPSDIEVIANGGRQEVFKIRWPEDRIALPGDIAGTSVVSSGGAFVFRQSGQAVSAEIFRLRNSTDRVIGLAARTIGRMPGRGDLSVGSMAHWSLLIPSRGSLLLAQQNSADISPQASADGYALPAEIPAFWGSGKSFRITAGPAVNGRGKILRGSQEFQDLQGSYSEVWDLASISEDGRTQGTITLSTLTSAEP